MEVSTDIDLDESTPRCPRCFNKDIVPSLRRGFIDNVMWRLQRIPRQCRSCGKRFYRRVPVQK